jgi:hypothetical protein
VAVICSCKGGRLRELAGVPIRDVGGTFNEAWLEDEDEMQDNGGVEASEWTDV